MRSAKYSNLYEGIQIWQGEFNPDKKIKADVVIGHSIGAYYALLNWLKFKNYKLILVNPPLPQKKILPLIFRWTKYITQEPVYHVKTIAWKYLLSNILNVIKLHQLNIEEIINQVSRDNLYIIRGVEDKYFCDVASAQFIKNHGWNLIEVPGCGHNWNKKFDEVIAKLKLQ